MVRWTMWNPPIPFFGQPTEEPVSVVIYLISGMFEVFVAVCLYRVDIRAIVIGIPYNLVQLTSGILSWELWDSWVAEMVLRRREYQGLPVREGEVEYMQSLTPEFLIATLAVGIVLLLLAIPRLRRPATSYNG